VYDRSARRRGRVTLGGLVLGSLVLLTVYFGESPSGVLHTVQRGAQEILAPIESGATTVASPVRDAIGWVGDVASSGEDQDRLESEVARLERELARAKTDQREARELRELAGLSNRAGFPEALRPVTGRIIARSPTVWYSTVQIDRGSADGVEDDDPVVSGAGLVGRVTSVTKDTARVRLITDASSAVSARILPGGAAGIVMPEIGQPDDLLVNYIEKGRDVKVGETVVSSGSSSSRLESLFPRGVPIGRVTRVDEEEFALYQRVHIEPLADVRSMSLVQVLTDRPSGEQAAVEAE
jgi:rod shape-determining protein MreC